MCDVENYKHSYIPFTTPKKPASAPNSRNTVGTLPMTTPDTMNSKITATETISHCPTSTSCKDQILSPMIRGCGHDFPPETRPKAGTAGTKIYDFNNHNRYYHNRDYLTPPRPRARCQPVARQRVPQDRSQGSGRYFFERSSENISSLDSATPECIPGVPYRQKFQEAALQ
ncbi:hypothetical protein RRG08_001184 [Elysia crispata]|uniref:Uncharacterized protein n=1 Tax=Elysia crispata TaxID=231223 RepID=A0AAE1ADV1_9GAST|nr:hypothetical protein RRG08_001184 [Elysia crispata]